MSSIVNVLRIVFITIISTLLLFKSLTCWSELSSFREQGWLLDREVENKFLSYYQVESAYNKTVQ